MLKSSKYVLSITLGAMIAALYVILTLPFAQFSFGMIQFRLAEVLTLLPALNPAAIFGVTMGCLLANLLNPDNLGPIDIICGTLATLVAATLTYLTTKGYRKELALYNDNEMSQRYTSVKMWFFRIVACAFPIAINALVVGTYLPFLLMPDAITPALIISSIATIGLCEAVVVFVVGIPLLLAWERIRPIRG